MMIELAASVANVAFERVSRMSQRFLHLKPMAFEALMHMSLQTVIDPSFPVREISKGLFLTKPVQIRARNEGIAEFSDVILTDSRYCQKLLDVGTLACCHNMTSEEIFDSYVQGRNAPIVVDPLTDHALCLSRQEVEFWLNAWMNAPGYADHFDYGLRDFGELCSHPQALLDRLDVLFSSLEQVERAYIFQAHRRASGGYRCQTILIVECDELTVLERIRRALPLVGIGLSAQEVPTSLLIVNWYPKFSKALFANKMPIFDRSVTKKWKFLRI